MRAAAQRVVQRIEEEAIRMNYYEFDGLKANAATIIDEELKPFYSAMGILRLALISILENHNAPRAHRHGQTTKICEEALRQAKELMQP